MLIQGFNTFLPPGYRIECGTDTNPDIIRVTTPSGRSALANYSVVEGQSSDLAPSSLAASGRQEFHEQGRPGWQSHSQPHPSIPRYSPSRVVGRNIFGQQISQSSGQEAQLEYQREQEQAAANAAIAHHQEQQNVSQLQNAASAAASGALGRPSMMQISPGGGQASIGGQAASGSLGASSQASELNKRGPVEFNHAISYVNKIKVSNSAHCIFQSLWLTTRLEPLCFAARDLQAVLRDLADIPARI